ncbi:MAG: hypothetical protein Unbinned6224contig1001_10 [Prokaryotic dsDNA virus sp.]|nr:MAG: hypothetical protein Unbinned6224contig1001_10 [Prokaryotic dsDNA virus sp.]|tara:strand:+ start:4399 stop:4590 length:192 start_codon:yes stop_codon:yes gene_type:complete
MKNTKTVRINLESIESKWSAFSLYAKKLKMPPQKLLGIALNEYITRNLDAITTNLNEHYELED